MLSFKSFISFSLTVLCSVTICSAAGFQLKPDPTDSLQTDTLPAVIYPDDPVLAALDALWELEQMDWQNFESDSNCLNVYAFASDEVPVYDDSVMTARMAALNELTPINLVYNSHVKAFINLYVSQRRDVSSRVLGLASLYYPMFEEKLDMFDMPLELKHLAVVESALNATAKSRVGATGLWQFMYTTGKMFGLEVDTYVDDRKDPYDATIAACRYMRYLYGIYGDWNLVLAAYNSGPGNVNKAIRRSGGKKDYWEIRPWLPRETRGYVPAFIAVNYMMNYATEHNMYPVKPAFLYAEIDTVNICRSTTLEQIAYFTEVSVDQLELLNPSIKQGVIPKRDKCKVVYLPKETVGIYLANEDSLDNHKILEAELPEAREVAQSYTVKRGDVLGVIAQKHGVGLAELKEWNNLRNNNIQPGQKLVIHQKVKVSGSTEKTSTAEVKTESAPKKSGAVIDETTDYREHTVQSGDTLWDIANKYPGISVTDIKKANSGLNHDRLKPGQKIKIPSTT